MNLVRSSVIFLISALCGVMLAFAAHAQPADQLSWIVKANQDLPARAAPLGVSVKSLGGADLYLVTFRDAASRDDILKTWKEQGVIQFAEPDRKVRLNFTMHSRFYDVAPMVQLPWYLQYSLTATTVNNASIGTQQAWNFVRGARSTVIAIIDSGINPTHVSLRDNLWPTTGWNFLDDNSDVTDRHGHGTRVAGIIAAQPSATGTSMGVMWQASLMALRACTSECVLSAVTQAVYFAIRNGARIINMSFSDTNPSDALRTALEDAGRQNILVVVSAGNDGTNNDQSPRYPCNYDLAHLVCVGSSDRQDRIAAHSNFGRAVHLLAPGVDIPYPSHINTGYECCGTGTSFAAPIVSGAAGLMLDAEPDLRAPDLKRRLMETVWRTNAPVRSGGRLDAREALNFGTTSGSARIVRAERIFQSPGSDRFRFKFDWQHDPQTRLRYTLESHIVGTRSPLSITDNGAVHFPFWAAEATYLPDDQRSFTQDGWPNVARPGTTTLYRVIAWNGRGYAQGEIWAEHDPPPDVARLALSCGANGNLLTWTGRLPNIEISRSVDGGPFQRRHEGRDPVDSHLDGDAPRGHAYKYRVRYRLENWLHESFRHVTTMPVSFDNWSRYSSEVGCRR